MNILTHRGKSILYCQSCFDILHINASCGNRISIFPLFIIIITIDTNIYKNIQRNLISCCKKAMYYNIPLTYCMLTLPKLAVKLPCSITFL